MKRQKSLRVRKPHHSGARRGFTLVELLVTISVIALLTTLMAPAMRGLVGVGGRRGGMNMLSTAVEQARLAAIENGVSAYVAFPAKDPGLGSGSIIILRKAREDEDDSGEIKAVTRWQRLPRGIYIETEEEPPAELQGAKTPMLGDAADPALVGFEFDRFGQLRPNNAEAVLRVGEKTEADASDFLGKDNNYFQLTIQPLTGRVVVEDKSEKK